MIASRGDYFGGHWHIARQPSGHIVSTCPAQPSTTYFECNVALAHVPLAVAEARRAFTSWRRLPIDQRAALIEGLKAKIDKANLAEAIAFEAGKPLWEAKTEVAALKAKIDVTLKDGRAEIETKTLAEGYVQHHAHGVMAVLGPFNFPLSLSHGHVVPSLLAGNTVVLKPSEQTPGVAQLYAELFDEFPPGVFNLVQGAGDVGQALATHPDVSGVLFTGSYHVGRALTLATIDQPGKILALEMGGKNATVIFGDADDKLALFETAFSAFVTCGQRCTATSRLILVDAEHLVPKLVQIASALRIGDPMAPDTFMGPLISGRAKEAFVQKNIDAAKASPEVLLPSRVLEGQFVTPQIVRGADLDVFREEIFGPSLAIYTAKNEEDAMRLANDTRYGLALSIFTQDKERFSRCLHDSRAGIVNWNKGTVGATGRLPFGGIGASGNFRPAGIYSMRYATYPVATVEGGSTLPALPAGFPAL